MSGFNDFIMEIIPQMKLFIDRICKKGNELRGHTFPPLSTDTWIEKELAMASTHIQNCEESWKDKEVSIQFVIRLYNHYFINNKK